jgi:cysteinyl-tRNA synthetase
MIAALHGLRAKAFAGDESACAEFAGSLKLIGFLSNTVEAWGASKQQAAGINSAKVKGLILDRAAARARKDFKESDRIRDELVAMGVVLKDGKDAEGKPVTSWEIAR